MVFEIEWLRGAQRELDAEIEYVLGRFGFRAARKTYKRIMDEVERLASFPHIGVQHESATYKGCEVRKIIIRQITVFYSPQSDKVTILAVWNNYQDPNSIPYRLSELE
ncbi:MAG: type II toxin-antitoxin system RelE/ParE family toxin [Bacteroidales bacterium]|nr:type II toxin-antitoxin system RelE/ParE family toxin [Bacteroidales bacterium]